MAIIITITGLFIVYATVLQYKQIQSLWAHRRDFVPSDLKIEDHINIIMIYFLLILASHTLLGSVLIFQTINIVISTSTSIIINETINKYYKSKYCE